MKNRKLLRIAQDFFGLLSIVFFVLAIVLMVVFLSAERTAEENKQLSRQNYVESTKRILFIRSYHSSYFTHEDQNRGLDRSLIPNGIEYDIFFMDTKGYGSENDKRVFHDYLKERLAKHNNYEALLLSDDEALKFAIQYREELFKGLKIVFFGINDYDLAQTAAKLPGVTGFYENQYIAENVDLAVKLFPERKTLVALHDKSEAGIADLKAFMAFYNHHADYSFVDIDATSYSNEELIEILENLPENSILFYMTCYADKFGNVYSMQSRTEMVIHHSRIPVFRNYEGGVGYGILGSAYMDFENQAYLAGKVIADVIKGKDIDSIPLSVKTKRRCLFDWKQMKKYHLDFSLLPPDAEFVNLPHPLLRQYKLLFLSFLFIIAGLLGLTVVSQFVSLHAKIISKELMISRDNLAKSEEELRYQAENDEILDIYNRRTIVEKLQEKIEQLDTFSIVIIDIDGFKALNESYGHAFADSILQYVVAMLKSMASDNDWMIGRYGGDEFLLFVPGQILTPEHQLITKLLEGIRSPIPLGDETLAITASVGIAVYEAKNEGENLENEVELDSPAEQIISYAETAMYEAKNNGRNGAALFDEQMKAKTAEEGLIKEELEKAFTNDGFFMVFQPQVNSKTKKVSGYEALIRMKAPGMYPGKFIPVAEHNGWIWKIGRITTELVVKQIAAWRDAGYEIHPVSVNFSSNQLNDHGYMEFLEELLRKYDVPPKYIEIEITEGVFLEKSALANDVFNRFKNMGIRLLMDDFGTGYSSLGYLTYIPVDVIKLDKSLVDAYLVDGKDSFIKNIIHLMHDLNKEMIIEGVEEEWQFKRLVEFDADIIQGYYFSKPLSADEAITFEVK